jgi:hypothetical protein
LSANNEATVGPPDTLFTVNPAEPGVTIVRRQAIVYFLGTTTPAAVDSFFRRFRARAYYGRTFMAVSPTLQFGIEFPDPGSAYSSLETRLDSMRTFPGVRTVLPMKVGATDARPTRYPTDAHASRKDYLDAPSRRTWPARAIRLPQAWSCEHGGYGGHPPRVTVIDAR